MCVDGKYLQLSFAGVLDQVASDYYGIRLSTSSVSDEPYEVTKDGCQYRIRLNFDNRNYMSCKVFEQGGAIELERKFVSSSPSHKSPIQESLAPIPNQILMQLFPFSLVFSSNLTIIAIGRQLERMYPSELRGKILTDVASLRRPKGTQLTWEKVLQL